MEFPTSREQTSGPSGPTNNEGETNAVYKPHKSKEWEMQNLEDVKKSDKERREQDWRNKVKIAEAHVEFKEEPINIISDFKLMWSGHLGQDSIAKHRTELSLRRT